MPAGLPPCFTVAVYDGVVRELLLAAKERGAAIIVVTHDSRLEAHADRIIHMEDGKILSDHMVTQPVGLTRKIESCA